MSDLRWYEEEEWNDEPQDVGIIMQSIMNDILDTDSMDSELKKSQKLIEMYQNADGKGKNIINEIFQILTGWDFKIHCLSKNISLD
jgi:hypothetical protein